MDDLIKIHSGGDGNDTVDARELHEFLESKQQFADWIKTQIHDYGFVENLDYVVFHNSMKNPTGGRPRIDYRLTIDMAKELSMVERNEKGKLARRYFIAWEERGKELAQKAEVAMLNDPVHLRGLLEHYTDKVIELKEQNLEMTPKAQFADAVTASETSIAVGGLAKLMRQNGVGFSGRMV